MWISMSLWYPEAQAAKELGYLFVKTPWWFQFSLAYPHSTMNLHLSTKRKPIEASEILSGTSYFHFQGASFSSNSKGFGKKKPFTPLFLWKKVSRFLFKPHAEPFSKNVIEKFQPDHFFLTLNTHHPFGLQNTVASRKIKKKSWKFSDLTTTRLFWAAPETSRNWKPQNPHLPTSRLQRTHILRVECHEGKGCQYGKQKTPSKIWWKGWTSWNHMTLF